MKRKILPFLLVVIIMTLVVGAYVRVRSDRAPGGTLEVSGRVYVEYSTVAIPLLSSTLPKGTATPGQPTVAGRLEWVGFSAGDHVTAGTAMATLDSTAPAAAVDLARAKAAESAAVVHRLGEKTGDATDARAELLSKRAELRSMLADLRVKRAEVADKLTQAREMVERGGQQASPQLSASVAQLEAALSQMDAGIAKATAGMAQLDAAKVKADDAITTLEAMCETASAAAQADIASTAVAEARLDLYTIRAPVDGTILEIVPAGSVVYAAAPLARIIPDGSSAVEAYVTADDAHRFEPGAKVRVKADYLSRPLDGMVTEVDSSFGYPPTFQATNDTHMLRGVRVRVVVDGQGPPPGVPVDLIVSTVR